MLQAGGKAMDWLNLALNANRRGYQDITGHPMDSQQLSALCDAFRPVVRALPLRRLMGALAAYTMSPHHLNHEPDRTHAPYAWIVQNGLSDLRPFIWRSQQQGPPQRLYASAPKPSPRRQSALPSVRGKSRLSYTAQRRSHLQHSHEAKRSNRD